MCIIFQIPIQKIIMKISHNISIFAVSTNSKLTNLLADVYMQDLSNKRVFLYIDDKIWIEWYKNLDIVNTKWLNIAQKRNIAIKNCNEDFLFLLDDDNRLAHKWKNNTLEVDKKWLVNIHKFWESASVINWQNIIISPTIFWRNTSKTQSWGIQKFNYFLSKVEMQKSKIDKGFEYDTYRQTWLIWGNSLYGKRELFEKVKFDKNIWRIREDLDYMATQKELWTKIFVAPLPIYHIERDKNLLERSFIQDFDSLQTKIRNRNIFVSKHATIPQKIQFYMFWYWWQVIYYLLLFFVYKFIRKTKWWNM